MNHFGPGDVVEIETPKGLAYVQVTHQHPVYSEIIRALPGLHLRRPREFGSLAAADAAFKAMVPLSDAIRRGKLRGARVDAVPVPAGDRPFPTFRLPIRDRASNVVYWWFWDGDGLSYGTEGRADIDVLPLRDVTTADALIQRLQTM